MTKTPEDSPALYEISDNYPEEFNGKVPKKIRVKVHPYLTKFDIFCDVIVNRYGLVAAILDDGTFMPIPSSVCEITEWHDDLAGSRKMTKTHAEFLEELKDCLIEEVKKLSITEDDDTTEDILRMEGAQLAFENVVKEINKFQAEQKQVSDHD